MSKNGSSSVPSGIYSGVSAPPGFQGPPPGLGGLYDGPPPGFSVPISDLMQPLLEAGSSLPRNERTSPRDRHKERKKQKKEVQQNDSKNEASSSKGRERQADRQQADRKLPKEKEKKADKRPEKKNPPPPRLNKSFAKAADRLDHNGMRMEGEKEECVLCCQPSDLFGVGHCRHPACMECLIRMRCIGDSLICHTCRAEVPVIYFVQKPRDWAALTFPQYNIPHPDASKFNIAFENAYAARCYDQYNKLTCPVCARRQQFADFPSFAALKNHMGSHQLVFCHICTDNLNVLPKDRATFSYHELDQHMKGTRNTIDGVKGHPQCQFCHERFFDSEQQYKHLRKEHFYCSLCDVESAANVFFNRIEQLHNHYKKLHHPCLDPDCVSMGIVFGNDVDLNVHTVQTHGGGNRSIPIDFQFSRNSSRFAAPSHHGNGGSALSSSTGVSVVPSVQPSAMAPGRIIPSAQFSGTRNVSLVPPSRVRVDDFPTLVNNPNVYSQSSTWRQDVQASRNQAPRNPAFQSDFLPPPSVSEQFESANHFPTLGTSRLTSSAGPSNTAWGKKNIVEAIKQPPQPKKKIPVPTALPRRQFIPSPDVWPENMQRKLEARRLGLPEPEDLEPPLPQPPLDLPKKKKEPKKKTVTGDKVKKKLEDQTKSLPNSSRFAALMAINGDTSPPNEWLSSSELTANQKAEKKSRKLEAIAAAESSSAFSSGEGFSY